MALPFFTACFMTTSCFKWAARAVDKLPEQTALDKTYQYDGRVIVIGAGASGLAAAKVLEQNNIDYLILEATNRYGGRLKKDTTLADFPIDIGAEWIHSAPVTLNKLKGKVGNEIEEELIPYHLESTFSWDGEQLKKRPDWENNFRYNFMPESKFKTSTWYDFVNDNIAKDIKHAIHYQAAVVGIDYSGDKVIVSTNNGEQFEADRVLVTVPIGVLRSNSISFVPDINQEKRKAIEAITFQRGFKVVLKFTEKFYPDAIGCKVKSGEKTFYDIAFKKETDDKVLGFLCTGENTEEYYKLGSEQEIVSALMQELDLMYDGKASQAFTGKFILENWGQYEFTQGTWTQAIGEKKAHLKILATPLDKKVYFAGEIFDPYQQMGVPGAILSGYYAADQMLTQE